MLDPSARLVCKPRPPRDFASAVPSRELQVLAGVSKRRAPLRAALRPALTDPMESQA